MKSRQSAQAANELSKAPTGITGFNEITRGGLPRARTTLLVGGPGSGKTIMALQFLAHGAGNCKEPGIFLTPTLVALTPPPVRKIVGTLSQLQTVLRALGLVDKAA